ncbi:MAG: Bug family tripartite tricarboxylate transporter substrate binding protein [Burkholderiales bacterium]
MNEATNRIARSLAVVGALVLSGAVFAQTAFPTKPLRIVVPYPPGGTVDLVGRTMGMVLAQQLGQQVVVENKVGASGTIGADFVAKSAPDGYTLLVNASLQVFNQFIMKSIPFDPIKDFTHISLIGSVQLIATAAANFPANNLAELIALAKANPGKYSFATSGIGSASHLAEEMVKRQAGLDMIIVVYKGSAPALTDVMGGQVSAMIDALPASYPHVKSGRLKALAVTGRQRASFLPDVPTAAESGLPGFEISSWYGLWAPAKLPADITARLAAEVAKAVKSKEVKDRLESQSFEPSGIAGAEFASHIDKEVATISKLIKEANIKVE